MLPFVIGLFYFFIYFTWHGRRLDVHLVGDYKRVLLGKARHMSVTVLWCFVVEATSLCLGLNPLVSSSLGIVPMGSNTVRRCCTVGSRWLVVAQSTTACNSTCATEPEDDGGGGGRADGDAGVGGNREKEAGRPR